MGETQVEISILDSVGDIDPLDWDACARGESQAATRAIDPFTTHRFLLALEQSGSVGPGTGWTPRPIVVRAGGQIIAVAPLYAKGNSQGEYVFDHAWAHAYEQAGGDYYPKLQIAAPFTPATGRRLLTRQGYQTTGQAALLQAAIQLAASNHLSSVHLTYCTHAEVEIGTKMGLMHRTGLQFHWKNQGYDSFLAFVANLSSRKRKNIRRERAQANDFGGQVLMLTGDQIKPEHWDAFWKFYQSTGAKKWGTPYLTRDFFDQIHQHMRNDVLLVLAERDGRPVAGALNFIGRDTLFGRYWGCTEHHPALHFELCYYRAIDYAIEHGLARIEAGAQGDHKLSRGYMPVTTHSLHWIAEPGFRRAVEQFLKAERPAVDHENQIITGFGPFRKPTPDV